MSSRPPVTLALSSAGASGTSAPNPLGSVSGRPAAAAAASSASQPAPPSSPLLACAAHWRGMGWSEHMDTGDVTVWKQCEFSAQLSWTGSLTLLGSGLSLVRRDLIGARGTLDAHGSEIADEKLRARLAKDRADGERFTGPVHTMASDDDAAPRIVPSPAQTLLESVRAELKRNQVARSYGCRGPQVGPNPDSPPIAGDVSVPFFLSATVNLKFGRVKLRKAHYRFVFNTVEYVGALTCIVMGPNGKPTHVHASALMESVEGGSEGRPPILGIELKLRSEYSTATIQLIPQPQQDALPRAQAAAEGSLAALSPSNSLPASVPRVTHCAVIPLSAPPRALVDPLRCSPEAIASSCPLLPPAVDPASDGYAQAELLGSDNAAANPQPQMRKPGGCKRIGRAFQRMVACSNQPER